MSRPSAPSMPTERQIMDVYATVTKLYPGARIVSVGPDGVRFEYPAQGADSKAQAWEGRPFGRTG